MENRSDGTEGENSGVFSLLTKLSEKIVAADSPSLTGKQFLTSVKKVRASLYGTLLGKYHVKEIAALSDEINHMSPLSWLIAQRFVLSNSDREKESSELDDAIREAFCMGWHDSPHPTLRILISLANTSSPSATYDEQCLEPFYLSQKLGLVVPGKDKRNLVCGPRIYPVLSQDLFKPPPWMSLKESVSPFGGYAQIFPFNKEPGQDLPLLQKFNKQPSKRNALHRPLYQLQPIKPLTEPKELNISSALSLTNFEDEGYFTPMTEVANQSHFPSECCFEDQTKIWSDALHVSLPKLKSWETLGNLVTQPEPPFISCASPEALHHLSTLVNMYQNVSMSHYICDPKPTTRADFLRGVFLLLIGIESTNFPFDKDLSCFSVRKGMWLEGYSVSDTNVLCQDFLYCGTNFRRLENLSLAPRTTALERDGGLMVKSLIDCIQRWTQFYRGAVLIISSHFQSEDCPLLLYEVLEYFKPLKLQVGCFSRLCAVENSNGSEASLPNGVELLAHIYREACKSNSQQSHLLYSALKSCCEVYLQCLQQWIFLGDCPDEVSNEFFIRKDPVFSFKRDRSFWNRGYVLDKKLVPVFLQGLEVAIFDCGRAMNLLQLCSPQHPLCVLLDKKHPTIRCCLYKSDMDNVKNECAKFEEEAQRVCGSFVTVSKLLDDENSKEANLHLLMQKAQKERDILRNSMKVELEKERAKKREKQNADLKAQILEVQQRKAAEKEQQRVEDEEYLRECQRLETAAQLLEKEQRQKLLDHYSELEKVVDKQNQHRIWQLKRLKLADKRNTFLYEDSISLSNTYRLLGKSVSLESSSDVHLVTTAAEQEIHTPPNESVISASTIPASSPVDSERSVNHPPVALTSSVPNSRLEAAAIKAKVLEIEFGLASVEQDNSQSPHSDERKISALRNSSKDLQDEVDASVRQQVSKAEISDDNCQLEPPSRSNSGVQEPTKNHIDDSAAQEYERNRKRVLTEDDCWMTSSEVELVKNPSVDSGIVTERSRNRQRILGVSSQETGLQESQSSISQNCAPLTELQKNRMKVLSEEFNVVTGQYLKRDAHVKVSVSLAKSDSGVETLPSGNGNESASYLVSEHKEVTVTIAEKGNTEIRNWSERPKLLSVLSNPSVSLSPLSTPHGAAETPVFTSPFKGTNNLRNGLPLASPLLDMARETLTHFEINGLPLMVDIADSFLVKFDTASESVFDTLDSADQKNHSDISRTLPNSSWLESSLQTCLLLPLRVQYQYVSAALLHFFLVDMEFLSHLKSLRSYFLMQDGEFGRHLTVKLFSQMYQVSSPDKLFNSYTLNRIVKEALASSQGTADPNHHRLALSFVNVPHHFSHSSPNVLDSLQLTYKVKWPLNLLLTPETLEKYNLIFLFLVRLKRVAWLLQEDFIALKNTARGCFKNYNRDLLNSPQYHQVQMIRHNMSQFVQATLNYVSSCVLHASWTDFASSMRQATTVDHIYNAHTEYIKRLLKRCLLNNNCKRVEAVLHKVLVCIIRFHSHLRVRPWQLPTKQHGHTYRTTSTYLEHPHIQELLSCSAHFKLQVSKLLSYLERLVSPPNQQHHLAEYLLLLNLNGFYKSSDYLKHIENVQASEGKSATNSQSRDLLSSS